MPHASCGGPNPAVSGRLFLVPTPLDFGTGVQGPLEEVLPWGTIKASAGIRHWICENAKSTRTFLSRLRLLTELAVPMQDMQLLELPRQLHKDPAASADTKAIRGWLTPTLAGADTGLISEAGMPAVADPGAAVVATAHDLGIEVVPLVGPVSMLLALAASGLNGQNFAFVGYLPIEPAQRKRRIRELESLALRTGQTQLFIEVPHRNATLVSALLDTLQPGTRLMVASGLTLDRQLIRSERVYAWRRRPTPELSLPTIFGLGSTPGREP